MEIGRAVCRSGGKAVGVGSGLATIEYLVSLIDGVNIIASDNFLDSFETERKSFLPVVKREAADMVLSNPTANCLLLVWPPLENPMAVEALHAFQQKRNGLSRVVYWGEGGGGCHANDKFHEALEKNWTLEKKVPCVQRWCIKDLVWIYRSPDSPILDRKRKTAWLTDIQTTKIQSLLDKE